MANDKQDEMPDEIYIGEKNTYPYITIKAGDAEFVYAKSMAPITMNKVTKVELDEMVKNHKYPEDGNLVAMGYTPSKPTNEAREALTWEEIPDQPYTTLEAKTPFGSYRLEWKGWKDTERVDIQFQNEQIEDAWGWDIAGAKEHALEDYRKRLSAALDQQPYKEKIVYTFNGREVEQHKSKKEDRCVVINWPDGNGGEDVEIKVIEGECDVWLGEGEYVLSAKQPVDDIDLRSLQNQIESLIPEGLTCVSSIAENIVDHLHKRGLITNGH